MPDKSSNLGSDGLVHSMGIAAVLCKKPSWKSHANLN